MKRCKANNVPVSVSKASIFQNDSCLEGQRQTCSKHAQENLGSSFKISKFNANWKQKAHTNLTLTLTSLHFKPTYAVLFAVQNIYSYQPSKFLSTQHRFNIFSNNSCINSELLKTFESSCLLQTTQFHVAHQVLLPPKGHHRNEISELKTGSSTNQETYLNLCPSFWPLQAHPRQWAFDHVLYTSSNCNSFILSFARLNALHDVA